MPAFPHVPPTTSIRLVAADPFEHLLALWAREIDLRARHFTNERSSPELDILRCLRAELEGALCDARSTQVFGNVAAAAALTSRPKSTVRRICHKRGKDVGASFVEGEWLIHLPTFQEAMAAGSGANGVVAKNVPRSATKEDSPPSRLCLAPNEPVEVAA